MKGEVSVGKVSLAVGVVCWVQEQAMSLGLWEEVWKGEQKSQKKETREGGFEVACGEEVLREEERKEEPLEELLWEEP